MLIIVTLASFVAIVFSPYATKLIINYITNIEHTNLKGTLLYSILFGFSYFFRMLLFNIFHYLKTFTYPKTKSNIRMFLLNNIIDYNYKYFIDNFAGSLSSYIKTCADSIIDIIKNFCYSLLSILIPFLLTLIMFSKINKKIGIITFIWLIIYFIISIYLSKLLKDKSKEYSNNNNDVYSHITDVLSNILSIKLFYTKKHELEIVDNKNKQIEISYINKIKIKAIYTIIQSILCSIILFVNTYISVKL